MRRWKERIMEAEAESSRLRMQLRAMQAEMRAQQQSAAENRSRAENGDASDVFFSL